MHYALNSIIIGNQLMLTDDDLILSPDKTEVSIKIQSRESEIKAVEIYQLIGRSDVSDWFKVDDNIIKATDLINLASKESDPQDNKSQVESLVIAKQINAKIDIEFSDDEMKAYAAITAPYSGKFVDIADILVVLSQHNLTQSIHEDGLDEFITAANAAEAGTKTRFHILSGTLPIDGQDSRFELLVDTMEQRTLTPKKGSHGKVDMHELGDILTVKLDTELIRRHPPTPGTPGMTVLGEPIAPISGQLHNFVIGDGTVISSADPDLLVAARVGIPRPFDTGVTIDDVLVIDNVDVGFGNVRFEGSVLISGDVCEGLKVFSNGNITVGGAVNSATLDATGNITVANGIVGKKDKSSDHEFTCSIKAGGCVNARFIQYCDISSGEDVIAATHILHSTVQAGGNVTVTNATGTKGTLSGGSVLAGQKISAVELGGNSGNKTTLTIEGALPELRLHAKKINKLLQQEHELLKRLLAAHEKVGHLDSGEKKQQLLQQLKRNVDKKIQVVVNIQAQKLSADQEISEFLAKASIESARILQQGVQFEIDGKTLTTQRSYKQTITRITKGKLLISPVNKEKVKEPA